MVGDRHVFGLPFLRTPGRLCFPQCFFSPSSVTPSRGDQAVAHLQVHLEFRGRFEKRDRETTFGSSVQSRSFPGFLCNRSSQPIKPSGPSYALCATARRSRARRRGGFERGGVLTAVAAVRRRREF